MITMNRVMMGLGYLGLVPFCLGLGLVITDKELVNIEGHVLFVTYSTVILSFLSGVLWGRSIEKLNRSLTLILSNVFAILAWVSLLQVEESITVALLLLMAGYVCVLVTEYPSNFSRYQHPSTSHKSTSLANLAPYSKMRVILTSVVLMMHLILFLI
ncbi:DUF3429 domain-containing protein [Vibrio genomosp. F10 str. 9ZC157]|uniref:DUF3429 domain-containing protein n=1 Tax=Vibrio genomosp. F10 str. ZF-129 TaxID=1187848 RepID=A0A1E5BIB0_9VIBR|nr:DUF3429 domain-containing protein [Vibrio genomosp. F10]OEE37117.1 hypothetical protein A1QO_04455 [Vibrio genomosp. F10 str. ZF-129]OEE94107.1 hypothetical protein A1QM_01030 [Vibrio genomosp. F10 str. 9ZC157]